MYDKALDDVTKNIDDLWEMVWLLRVGQSGGGSGNIVPWTADVLPAASPFTPTAAQQYVAVNTSTGAVTVLTPLAGTTGATQPFNGQTFTVKATAASATPITIQANGAGVTVEDPSNGGTFGATGSIQAVAGGSATWKFRASDKKWIAFGSF
jgi:hypothetical protein